MRRTFVVAVGEVAGALDDEAAPLAAAGDRGGRARGPRELGRARGVPRAARGRRAVAAVGRARARVELFGAGPGDEEDAPREPDGGAGPRAPAGAAGDLRRPLRRAS